MQKRRIVVIGGSAAGAKAAAKARRLDQHAEITIVQKDPDLSMAACAYPYYVDGTFTDRNMLLATPTGVVRDPVFFQKTKMITALTSTKCTSVDTKNKAVTCCNLESGQEFSLPYDKLIMAMGAKANLLPVPGRDLEGVTAFLSMQDTDYIHDICESGRVQRAVVVGGGLIGVETCEALSSFGIEVTLIEMEQQILTFLDAQLAMLVENHMRYKAVDVRTGMKLENCIGENGRLVGVQLANGEKISCELAAIAAGVSPNTALAADADLAIGEFGGIQVNEYMQSSDKDIYAAGDCVECINLITGKSVYAPMGDLANLQAGLQVKMLWKEML